MRSCRSGAIWSRSAAAAGAAGLALSLLLGSGLIAAVSDSVGSIGNSAQSGTYEPVPPPPPAGHDLKAALIPTGSMCDEETLLSDGPLTAAFTSASVDLYGTTSTEQPGQFCLRNSGESDGSVLVAFGNVVQTEVGEKCEVSESGAGGDQSCGPDDSGELADVIQVQFVGTTCAAPASTFESHASGARVMSGKFGRGETCAVSIHVSVDPSAAEAARLRAQTDAVQWDVVFTLEDAS